MERKNHREKREKMGGMGEGIRERESRKIPKRRVKI